MAALQLKKGFKLALLSEFFPLIFFFLSLCFCNAKPKKSKIFLFNEDSMVALLLLPLSRTKSSRETWATNKIENKSIGKGLRV